MSRIDPFRLAYAMRLVDVLRTPGAYPHLGQDNDLRRFATDLADQYDLLEPPSRSVPLWNPGDPEPHQHPGSFDACFCETGT